jgi:hypothetical protein
MVLTTVVLALKKNDKLKICVNYKALNKVIKKTDIFYHFVKKI